MRTNALILSIFASLTSLAITSETKPRYGPRDVGVNKFETVIIPTTSTFDVGGIDLSPSDSNYMYSPFNVKFKRKIRNPKLYVTLDYVNKNGYTIYLYKNYDTSLDFNTSLNTFFGEMKVDLNMLAETVTFHAKIWLARSRDEMDFKFTITNPRRNAYLVKGVEKRIYTSFVKNYNEHFGRNYYSSYYFMNDNNFNNKLFYYNHFDFNKNIYYKSNDPFSINEAMLYVYDPKTTLFNNAGINLPSFSNTYKFFPLISVQGKEPSTYKFEFGTQYYVDPVTNLMSNTEKIGSISTKNSIFMPLKHYQDFKTTKFGFLIDTDVYSLRYRLVYEFKVTFEEHYYKNDFVIYKTIEKKTKDGDMKEITL